MSRHSACGHDQPVIARSRECHNLTLDFGWVAHANRCDFDPERLRYRLDQTGVARAHSQHSRPRLRLRGRGFLPLSVIASAASSCRNPDYDLSCGASSPLISLRRRVFAADLLGVCAFGSALLVLQTSDARPGALEIVAHCDVQRAAALAV